MENYRAIPEGYMRVGELAKKAGISTNALRYYDREGLLSPSSESEGGYRLYTDKDMVKLIQILTMKQLGFSLDDIKKRIVALDTPADMVNALTEHSASIRKKIENLSESFEAIEALKAEVIQMKTMDFKKYADILMSLQMKNENYWAIKHMDEDVMSHFRNRSAYDKDSASTIMESWGRLAHEAEQLQKEGISPESEKGQNFAKAVWAAIQEFTGGDADLISKFAESMDKLAESKEGNSLDGEKREKLESAYNFMQAALDAYMIKAGHDPFE